MRKPLFYHFRRLILASEIDQEIMFFHSRFLDLLFLIFFNLFQKLSILGPPSKSDGVKNPLRVRWRTQQSVSGRFSPFAVSLSCTAPYLTSPFFMLSHWVSVSAGNHAIAVARKVRVLGAPEIENGFKNHQKSIAQPPLFSMIFRTFQKSRKNKKSVCCSILFKVFSSSKWIKNQQTNRCGTPLF